MNTISERRYESASLRLSQWAVEDMSLKDDVCAKYGPPVPGYVHVPDEVLNALLVDAAKRRANLYGITPKAAIKEILDHWEHEVGVDAARIVSIDILVERAGSK